MSEMEKGERAGGAGDKFERSGGFERREGAPSTFARNPNAREEWRGFGEKSEAAPVSTGRAPGWAFDANATATSNANANANTNAGSNPSNGVNGNGGANTHTHTQLSGRPGQWLEGGGEKAGPPASFRRDNREPKAGEKWLGAAEKERQAEGNGQGSEATDERREALPAVVAEFVSNLYEGLYVRDLEKVRDLYEHDYPSISAKYFAHSNWPSMAVVREHMEKTGKYHDIVLVLYLELFYRHLFARNADSVLWQDRLESWHNYLALLDSLFESELTREDDPLEADDHLCLPTSWLWDIFDEFCYQLLNTSAKKWEFLRTIRERARPQLRPEESLTLSDLFNVSVAVEKLCAFARKSEVLEILHTNPQLNFGASVSKGAAGRYPVRYQAGFFASVSLVRLYNSLQLFDKAKEMTDALPLLQTPNLFSRMNAGCHSTLVYHYAFTAFMTRDYVGASRAAQRYLSTTSVEDLQATSTNRVTVNALERLHKRVSLLALLCDALTPAAKLDELLLSDLKDSFRSEAMRLTGGKPQVTDFVGVFRNVVPNFVSPHDWNQDMDFDIVLQQQPQELLTLALHACASDVHSLQRIDRLLAFARLYRNVHLVKLGTLTNRIRPGMTPAQENLEVNAIAQELEEAKGVARCVNKEIIIDKEQGIVTVNTIETNLIPRDTLAKMAAQLKDWTTTLQRAPKHQPAQAIIALNPVKAR